MKNIIFLFAIMVIILIYGCGKKNSGIVTYDLSKRDFIEKIDAAGTIQSVNIRSILAPRIPVSSMTVAYLSDDGSYIKMGDTVCVLNAPEMLSRLETYQTSYENLEADMKKLEADNQMTIALLEAQIDNNNVQLKLNSLDSIQQIFAPPLSQKLFSLELEKAEVERGKLQKKHVALTKIIDSDLRKMKSRLMVEENMVKTATTQLNSLTIVAPSDGMIMHVVSPTMMFFSGSGLGTLGGKIEVGSSVWSNMALLQIPDLDKMQVSIEVPETDYKRIEKGQKTSIVVDAAKDLKTTGTVLRKSLIGKKTPNESAVKTYEVIISVDSCHLMMKPGLSCRCEIMISEIKDTVVVPAIAIFMQDSSKVVYVSSNDGFIPVVIETGLANSSQSIVSGGLDGNETIALTEPPYNLIRKDREISDEKEVSVDTISKHQL